MNALDLEIEFGELLGDYYLSNAQEDMLEHWDVAIKFDIKSQPKSESIKGYRWVEIVNVNGELGSLCGTAKFMVFEEQKYFIIVNREKLKDFVIKNIKDEFVTQSEWRKNPQPFLKYQRQGRKDVITLVPLIDLCYLGRVVKKKVT